MNPVIIFVGVVLVGYGLILEAIEKKKQAAQEPIVEETDAEKTARLAAEETHAKADHHGNNNGANNGSDSGAISEAEASTDKSSTSIGLDS